MMGAYSFRTHMPMALHPNSYLDVIYEQNQLEARIGWTTIFDCVFENEVASKGIGSIPLFASRNGELRSNSNGRLLRHPIRWKKPEHKVVLNRNTTYWVSQKQKKESHGMGGIVRYKQPKRGVAAQMFDYNKQLFLMKRASERDHPHGFEFQKQYELAINNLKSEVIGGDESSANNDQGDVPFPILRFFEATPDLTDLVNDDDGLSSYFHIKDSANNRANWTKGWYNIALDQSFMRKLKKSQGVDPATEPDGVREELESLVALKSISQKRKYPFNGSALLNHHRFAYFRMLTDGCETCGKEKGEPCSIESLSETKTVVPYVKITYNNIGLSRLYTASGSEIKNNRKKELKEFLTHYYTYGNIYNKPDWEGDGIVTQKQADTLWEAWDNEHRQHALNVISMRGSHRMPFSCEQRLNYSEYEVPNSFATISKAGMFPLTLRSDGSTPNEGVPNRFFGGTHPPSLTVQNLWIDLMKRVLAMKLREIDKKGKKKQQDRFGIAGERHDNQDTLLWDIMDDDSIRTIWLDAPHGSDGRELPILQCNDSSLSRSNTTECWLWHDERDWDNQKGKLPIVSMNTSIQELEDLFKQKEALPGVVVSIDQWLIDGDNEPYQYANIDTEYGINSQRFAPEEQAGARSFATFLKRVIDTSSFGILSNEVRHTRRAYGVLLNPHFEGNKE